MFEGLFGEDGEDKGFKDRLGVSRMMRELEGLRIGDGRHLAAASVSTASISLGIYLHLQRCEYALLGNLYMYYFCRQ